MEHPNVLLVRNLLKPANIFIQRITNIATELQDAHPNSAASEGLFVLAISALEVMLLDTYEYYLHQFPMSVATEETMQIKKKSILSAVTALDLLDEHIEKRVRELGYGKLTDSIALILDCLSIAPEFTDENLMDRILEAKETRNLLLHANLKVNATYLAKAGPAARTLRSGGHLPLDHAYIRSRVEDVNILGTAIRDALASKFAGYTKARAMKELWNYLFSSPVLIFEDYWVVDNKEGTIRAILRPMCENGISTSEHMFLTVLRQHFGGDHNTGPSINVYKLDSHSKAKLIFLYRSLEQIGPW